MRLISLQDAKEGGKKRYFTGVPCNQGHTAERLVSSRACVQCSKAKRKAWAVRNRDHVNAKMRSWNRANPAKIKAYTQKYRPKKLAQERLRQGLPIPTRPVPSECEICGAVPEKRVLSLDHCHVQGTFRGWLCGPCNLGLAMFKDNPVAFLAAFRYLAQSQMPHIQLVELTPEQAAQRGLQ